MSVVKPTIDDLLSVTDENRFLLCEIASRRARDVNDMIRNQHNRAEQLADVEDHLHVHERRGGPCAQPALDRL